MKTILDGKEIEFTHLTEFNVQVGKGSKGSYKTKYHLMGSLAQAVMYYNGINIGNGYKKRLVMWVQGEDNRLRRKIITRAKS